MKRLVIAISIAVALVPYFPVIAHADDVAEVKAAEIAVNAAENAGDADGMFEHFLPDRAVFGFSGGHLVEGWTEESKKRRQAAFDAGRKFDLRIEELNVRIYGETAITTFYRVGNQRGRRDCKTGAPTDFRCVDSTTRRMEARSSPRIAVLKLGRLRADCQYEKQSAPEMLSPLFVAPTAA